MFFEFSPSLREISMADVNSEHLTAGYLLADEFPAAIERFGFYDGIVSDCMDSQDNYRNSIDVYENCTFGLVNIVDANDASLTSDRVAFFFQKNLFLLITLRDLDGSTKDLFMQSLKRCKTEALTLEKLIYGFLESTIAKDAPILAKMEFAISDMEEQVAHGHVNRTLNSAIYQQKKRLLLLQNYYEQLLDLGEGLQENENEIFSEETLHYFALFTAKVDRLCTIVERLCASLNELRSAHQAAMDYSLNSVMKLLSIITTIFLPLTLIVGWYGMNFRYMPELEWRFGYIFVIGLALAVIILSLSFFKKNKLL